MKNYSEFILNENIFKKKSFDSYMSDIDKYMLELRAYNTRIDTLNMADREKVSGSIEELNKASDKAVFYFYLISKKFEDLLLKFSKTITQEELNELVRRFDIFAANFIRRRFNLNTGVLFRSHCIKTLKKVNTIIYNIGYLIDIKDFEIDYEVRDEDGSYKQYYFFKYNKNFWEILDRKEYDKKKKESIEAHKDIDPYNEDDWTE